MTVTVYDHVLDDSQVKQLVDFFFSILGDKELAKAGRLDIFETLDSIEADMAPDFDDILKPPWIDEELDGDPLRLRWIVEEAHRRYAPHVVFDIGQALLDCIYHQHTYEDWPLSGKATKELWSALDKLLRAPSPEGKTQGGE